MALGKKRRAQLGQHLGVRRPILGAQDDDFGRWAEVQVQRQQQLGRSRGGPLHQGLGGLQSLRAVAR